MSVLDSLPTVSPICDAAQIPSIAGSNQKGPAETQFSMDFLVGSGNEIKSYLTFTVNSVPLMENDMNLAQLIPASEFAPNEHQLRVLKVICFRDQYIIVNYRKQSL